MKVKDLLTLDMYRRKLWMYSIPKQKLHLDTTDPILLEEEKGLRDMEEEIDSILKFEKGKNNIIHLNTTLDDFKFLKDYNIVLVRDKFNVFEIRGMMLHNNFKWNSTQEYKFKEICFFSNKFYKAEILFHSIGLFFGSVMICNDNEEIYSLLLSEISQEIERLYSFKR